MKENFSIIWNEENNEYEARSTDSPRLFGVDEENPLKALAQLLYLIHITSEDTAKMEAVTD